MYQSLSSIITAVGDSGPAPSSTASHHEEEAGRRYSTLIEPGMPTWIWKLSNWGWSRTRARAGSERPPSLLLCLAVTASAILKLIDKAVQIAADSLAELPDLQ